ncbi:hypothetical protein RMN62_06340 [Providencia stuartii]|nr:MULTISPECIES: hypothetical protein [Providencia]MDT1065996.1 hypothetical protein [Providencia stuartii]
MSATANWSYTNIATIYPVIHGGGEWGDETTYGLPYLIDCTWQSSNEVVKDDMGKEFVTNNVFFTELKRNGVDVQKPERGFYIAKGDTTSQSDPRVAGADIIITVKEDDMSFFGEDPDYEIRTWYGWQS